MLQRILDVKTAKFSKQEATFDWETQGINCIDPPGDVLVLCAGEVKGALMGWKKVLKYISKQCL